MKTKRVSVYNKIKKCTRVLLSVLLVIVLTIPAGTGSPGEVYALTKPQISSEGAYLLNATTGEMLFEKNGDKQFYPASITKLMTALVVLENSSLDDTVTFSETATTNLESGAVTLGLTAGETLSERDCMYGMLLKSANEIANALAEHVSGSIEAFTAVMNARAVSLGCTHTNFTNVNGLNDSRHLTTPHDMALIARACFENDTFCNIDSTVIYNFPATKYSPNQTTIVMGNKMLNPGDPRYYNGVIGGKTGYTSKAGNTLVTAAQRNGVRLIAVVMKSSGTHYEDTKALFDYGFEVAKTSPAVSQTTADSSNTDSTTSSSSNTAESSESSSQTGSQSYGPGAELSKGWHEDGRRWYYIKDNSNRARSERIIIKEYEYWFDSDGYMATGWRQDGEKYWYYMRPSFGGMKKAGWIMDEDDNKWYYLSDNGRMLANTTTPDGYKVGASGAWIQ